MADHLTRRRLVPGIDFLSWLGGSDWSIGSDPGVGRRESAPPLKANRERKIRTRGLPAHMRGFLHDPKHVAPAANGW
jgi:hypothetical protein